MRILLPSLLCFLLSACADYDITVNDTPVYGPASLFSDFHVEDPALRTCIAQAIADGQIRSAGALTALNCSHAGIEDLQGLATFSAITRLKLSSNRIRNLMELTALTDLSALYLDDNVVVDPVPLYRLALLRELDLAGNAALQCPEPGALARVASLRLPQHCRGEGAAP